MLQSPGPRENNRTAIIERQGLRQRHGNRKEVVRARPLSDELGGLKYRVSQVGHGFGDLAAVYYDAVGAEWVAATAAALEDVDDQQLGIVVRVVSVDTFDVAIAGTVIYRGATALTDTTTYYLKADGSAVTLAAYRLGVSFGHRRALFTVGTGSPTTLFIHGPESWGAHDHGLTEYIEITGHGFGVGAVLKGGRGASSSTFALATVDDDELLGVVTAVPDPDHFVIGWNGVIDYDAGSLSVRGIAWLLPGTPGTLSTTPLDLIDPTNADYAKYRAVLVILGNGKALILPPTIRYSHHHRFSEMPDLRLTSLANHDLLQYDLTSTTWKNVPASSITPSDATTSAKGIVQLAGDLGGSGTTAAAPKVIDATASVKGKIQLGGDLAGTGSTAAAPKLTATAVTPASYTFTAMTVGADGRVTAASNGSQALAGDVTGTFGASNVAKLQGVTLTPGSLVAGMVMYYTGSVWQGFQFTVTRGDIMVQGATLPQRLSLGAVKKYLRSDGTDLNYDYIKSADLPTRVGIDTANGDPASTGVAVVAFNAAAELRFFRGTASASDLIAASPTTAKWTATYDSAVTAFGSGATGALKIQDSSDTTRAIYINDKMEIQFIGSSTKKITLRLDAFVDLSGSAATPTGTFEIRPREIDVCVAGVAKKCVILASAAY